MRSTIDRFPHLELPLRALAEQHRAFEEEPLHLALVYDPGRETDDIYLFEVLGNFGRNEVSPEGDLFEASFSGTDALPLVPGQKLHLVLTNPVEWEAAIAGDWPAAGTIRRAVARGDFTVLFEDEVGTEALNRVRD